MDYLGAESADDLTALLGMESINLSQPSWLLTSTSANNDADLWLGSQPSRSLTSTSANNIVDLWLGGFRTLDLRSLCVCAPRLHGQVPLGEGRVYPLLTPLGNDSGPIATAHEAVGSLVGSGKSNIK